MKFIILLLFSMNSFSSEIITYIQKKRNKNINIRTDIYLKIKKFGKEDISKSFKVTFEKKEKVQKLLVEVTSPIDLSGIKNLIIRNEDGSFHNWLRLKNGSIKRMKPRLKCKSLYGSEFSCEDIYFALFKKPQFLKSESKKEHIVGELSFVGSLKKYRSNFRIDNYWPDNIQLLTPFGKTFKNFQFSDYIKIGNQWVVQKISVENIRNGKVSTLMLKNTKLNSQLDDNFFDPETF